MYEQLPAYFLAQQIDRESLDHRAATAWTASTASSAGEKRWSLKTIAVAIAIALAGIGGTGVALADDDHAATAEADPACNQDSGEIASSGAVSSTGDDSTNGGSIAPQKTDEDGDVIPMPLSDGRPW